MAWVVPEKHKHLFDDIAQGSVIAGSKLIPGVVSETVQATVTRAGKCKGGRFYECDLTFFGVDLGKEVFMVKENADG